MRAVVTWTVLALAVLAATTCMAEIRKADEEEIIDLIRTQELAWNSGDLAGFMQPYWHSEKLTFQSGNRRLNGWQSLHDMYRTNYAGNKMGRLTFTDLAVNRLAGDVVMILGRWKVEADGQIKEGLFTLIWKKIDGSWKIIHDHSS